MSLPKVPHFTGECSCCDVGHELMECLVRSSQREAKLILEKDYAQAHSEALHEELENTEATKAAEAMRERCASRAWAILLAAGMSDEDAESVRGDLLKLEAC